MIDMQNDYTISEDGVQTINCLTFMPMNKIGIDKHTCKVFISDKDYITYLSWNIHPSAQLINIKLPNLGQDTVLSINV